MKPAGRTSRIWRNDRLLQAYLFALMALVYGVLLWNAVVFADPTSPLDHTFNSMCVNLLHGRFYVDPATVGDEGFLRDGRVYAYWGPFCALLRLPLVLIGRPQWDVTTLSCLLAACLTGMVNVRTVLLLRRQQLGTRATEFLFALMLAYVLFGGCGIGYLRSSIFQEVDLWAVAFGALFVYQAMRGLLARAFDRRTLCWMAAAAGLAVLTRVSLGIGLCVALWLLLLVLVLQRANELDAAAATRARRLLQAASEPRIAASFAVLALLLLVAGGVNLGRWGSPFTFADLKLYILNLRYPDRVPRARLYGYFNLRRLPLGLGYYFFPLWAFHAPAFQAAGGGLFFQQSQTRLIDAFELPPSSFLLTDLLPFVLIGYLVSAARLRRWRPSPRAWQAAALAAGLFLPCLLMLTAVSMTYRYRMDFYPEIDLLAYLGLYAALAVPALRDRLPRRRNWLVAVTVVTVLCAFLGLVLYKLSDFGPSQRLLRDGLHRYYATQLRSS